MVTTPTLVGKSVTVSRDPNAFGFDVTGLQDNNFTITWSDTLGDIHGRRLDSLGNFNSTDFLFNVSGNASKDVRLPDLVQGKDGSVQVFYRGLGGAAEEDVFVNFVDFDTVGGSATGFPSIHTAKDESLLDAAASEFNNTSDSVVVYTEPRGTTGVRDLYLAHIAPNGQVIGSPMLVPINAGESVSDAKVVGLPNGNSLVTYTAVKFDPVSGKVENFVRYRVYDDYTDLTGAVDAAPTPGNDALPAVAALERSSDGFVIATQDGQGIHYLYHGFGREFKGTVPGTEGSGSGGFAKAISPEITALKDQGFIIAWTDTSEREGDGSPAQRIALQRFDKDGNPVGDTLFVNGPGDQELESIDTLADGRVVITFRNETGDATNQFTHDYQIIDPRDTVINGTNGADNIVGRDDGSHIFGFAGNDSLIGGSGADTFLGGEGADTMTGAGGDDFYFVDASGDRVIERAGEGTDTVASSISFSLAGKSIEKLTLSGTGAVNGIGNEVANTILGNDAKNSIAGGLGNDVLVGNAGNDTFVFDKALGTSNIDHIRDFSHVGDTIQLENAVFKGLAAGRLSAGAFKDLGETGAKVDANDRILYNEDTGGLRFDADGSGVGKAVTFAILDGSPNTVDFTDVLIV